MEDTRYFQQPAEEGKRGYGFPFLNVTGRGKRRGGQLYIDWMTGID
jgi:hypothetical protein